jgi:ABC-2 type transport system ATP-binding protein
VVGFLGPNGAGKSTTLRILTGLLAPTSGRAFIDGHPVDDPRRDIRTVVSYLPETAPIQGELSVRAHLDFVARLRKVPQRKAAVASVLARCGLERVAHRLIGQLSKGYRQRVGLAQAILPDPPVLILDEPSSGLDPNQRVEIRSLINSLRADRTVIFSSHVLAEVEAVASRVIILDQGRVVADATPEQLRAGEGMRVQVGGVAPTIAAAHLTAVLGVPVVVHGDVLQTRAEPAAVARAVVAAGYDLLALTPATSDLETVFRRLTGAA